MANHSCALNLNLDQQRIPVAVRCRRDDLQAITRSLALGPQLIARPAVEGDIPDFLSLLPRLRIHKSQHQDVAFRRVLDDRGHQALHLVEVNLHFAPQPLFTTETHRDTEKTKEGSPHSSYLDQPDHVLRFSLCLCAPVVKASKNKKPAELCAQRAFNPCVLLAQPHTPAVAPYA